jgi:polysaccharide deacetylase family protein (PEP-CTERM system associated)
MTPRPLHHFTVDVEEYFQVSAMEPWVARERWDSLPSRVVEGTRVLLELLARNQVRGTFFTLGWVAERHPDLVREIAAGGHELASHGWDHRRVFHLEPGEFRTQVRDSRRILEDLSGTAVEGYRAPSFSIGPGREWALEILVEEGYRYDSSLYPVRRRGYGYPQGERGPWRIETPAGPLVELPPATLRVGRRILPAGGGGTFRQFPLRWTEAAFREAEGRGEGATFYLHPWEVDPGQPRVPGLPALTRVRHYRGISRALPRLQRLLSRFRFGSVREGGEVAALLRTAVSSGGLALVLCLLLGVAACSAPDPGSVAFVEREETPAPLPACADVSGAFASSGEHPEGAFGGWEVHEVARGLDVPWGIAPLPDGRLLVTERTGRVVMVSPEPLATPPAASASGVTPWLPEPLPVAALEEAGLLGVALHPDFEENGWVYLAGLFDRREERSWLANQWARVRVRLGQDEARPWELRVLRFTHHAEGPGDPGMGTEPVVVARGILSYPLHAGGALHLADPESLLLAVGDGFHPPAARDPEDPRGSLLRIPLDPGTGLMPRGGGPGVVASGVRNSQGMHSSGGLLFFVDHGPSGLDFEGRRMGKDELNVLPRGLVPDSDGLPDFGWPRESGIHDPATYRVPLAEWNPAVAPAGLAARPLDAGRHELFLTGLRGQLLVRVEVVEETAGAGAETGPVALCQEPLLEREWGRLRAVALGPDGSVWVSTSNGDGRGTLREGDDRILRLVRSGEGRR